MIRCYCRLLLRRVLEAHPIDLAGFALFAVWISLLVSK